MLPFGLRIMVVSGRRRCWEGDVPDPLMILATDTHYTAAGARTGGVLFRDWSDDVPHSTHLVECCDGTVAAYESGAFYKRELPLILQLLDVFSTAPWAVVVDGYVQLDGEGRPGLGAHLFDALGGGTVVIGVAKTAFDGSAHAIEVYRGASGRPLYVTAAGVPADEAGGWIGSMHGSHRQPTLLKIADRISREGAGAPSQSGVGPGASWSRCDTAAALDQRP